jgi:hypothetical protein
MKLTQARSGITWTMSPREERAPRLDVEHLPAREVTAAAKERQSVSELLRLAAPVLDPGRRPHRPLGVVRMQENGAIEAVGPLDHRGVVMRMRDRNRGDAPAALDRGRGLVVEQRDAVPEEVRVAPGHEECPLPDREGRFGADAEEAGVVADHVPMVTTEVGECRPLLTRLRHVLARVLADRAAIRIGSAELDAAGGADGELGHGRSG